MKTLFLSILLFIFPLKAQAAVFEFTQNCKSAYHDLFLLNFTKARTHLEQERTSNPENCAIFYIENYLDFITAFISEDPSDFSRLKKNMDVRVNALSPLPSNSPWKRYAKAEMFLQLAVVKLKWKEYLTAGYLLRKSYRLLEENKKLFPGFAPNLKALGFFHAVIGAVPDNYLWLANLAGMQGTISQGGNELMTLVNKTESDPSLQFMRLECYFIKIFVAVHFEKNNDAALLLLDKMKISIPEKGPLQLFIEANTLLLSGKYEQSLHVLKTYKQNKDGYPLYYLNYLSGMMRLNQLDMTADTDFYYFINNYKGKSFIKSAYHKLAWICLLKGDKAGYLKNLELVNANGNDFTDEDKQAQKEALSKDAPNLILLRSRLFFDGGNYSGALSELAGKPSNEFSNLRDQLEFTYRLARIFDKKGQKEKAINYYTITYNNGRNQTHYFAANAALNNGLIYEEQNKKEDAIAWYKKCLSLRNHDYQNSIDLKAEAGLNRMK
ncbi:MAG: hypothetical protein IPP71_00090 [Bacteroidetes bacterium]|nr:hypothetical protein [Bacteroidota bacterium]